MNSPHTLDLGRLKALEDIRKANAAVASKAQVTMNNLISGRNAIDIEISQLETAHLKFPGDDTKMADLRKARAKIDAQIDVSKAQVEESREKSKAASSLYQRCRDFLGVKA